MLAQVPTLLSFLDWIRQRVSSFVEMTGQQKRSTYLRDNALIYRLYKLHHINNPVSTTAPAHFDLFPRIRLVRPRRWCCRERPTRLMLTTAMVRLKIETKEIEIQWRQRMDHFSIVTFQLYSLCRCTCRIVYSHPIESISTCTISQRTWKLLISGVSGWCCQDNRNWIQSESGGGSSSAAEYIQNCRRFHMKNSKKDYSAGRFSQTQSICNRHRFLFEARARVCVCVGCLCVKLNDTYLRMMLFVTDTMPFVIFKRCSAERITTCVSTFCCVTDR